MKKYRPSNGSEGVDFTLKFCDNCIYDGNYGCPIIVASMLYEVEDKEYPNQLVYNPDPTCLMFHGKNHQNKDSY